MDGANRYEFHITVLSRYRFPSGLPTRLPYSRLSMSKVSLVSKN
nr:MAG TPA: hypothetical protein [Caudoviricetes sp.]